MMQNRDYFGRSRKDSMEAFILVAVRDSRNRYLTGVCMSVRRRPLQQLLPYHHMRNQPYEDQQTRRFVQLSGAHYVRITLTVAHNVLETTYLASWCISTSSTPKHTRTSTNKQWSMLSWCTPYLRLTMTNILRYGRSQYHERHHPG